MTILKYYGYKKSRVFLLYDVSAGFGLESDASTMNSGTMFVVSMQRSTLFTQFSSQLDIQVNTGGLITRADHLQP